jgi:hypothetical protein
MMKLELHHGEKLGRARICQAIVDRSPRTRGWWTDDGPTDEATAHLSGERLRNISSTDYRTLLRALSVWNGTCALTVDELLGASTSPRRRALVHLWAAIGVPWQTDQDVAAWFSKHWFYPLEVPIRRLLLRWGLIETDPFSIRQDAQEAAGEEDPKLPSGSAMRFDWRWRLALRARILGLLRGFWVVGSRLAQVVVVLWKEARSSGATNGKGG